MKRGDNITSALMTNVLSDDDQIMRLAFSAYYPWAKQALPSPLPVIAHSNNPGSRRRIAHFEDCMDLSSYAIASLVPQRSRPTCKNLRSSHARLHDVGPDKRQIQTSIARDSLATSFGGIISKTSFIYAAAAAAAKGCQMLFLCESA